jgi:hypothetical protein
LNDDGLPDLVLSGAEGPFVSGASFFYLPNQAAAPGEPWAFDSENQQLLNLNFHPGDRLAFNDVDQDGDQDLFVAKREGNMEYYKNLGSSEIPDWQLESESAGDISSSIFRRDLSILLHDFDGDGQADLLSSDASGVLSFRRNFVTRFNDEEVAADTAAIFFKGQTRNLKVDKCTWLAAARLNNSAKTYVLVGSPQGGIRLLSYDPNSKINESGLLLYPNPVSAFHQEVNVQSAGKIRHLQLISADGAVVWDQPITAELNRISLNTTGLAAGIYLVRAWQTSGLVSTAKLMVR